MTDRAGATSTSDARVDVVDTTPPELSVTAHPSVLTPPMQRMVAVDLDVTTQDVCGEVEVALTGAESNSPPHPSHRPPRSESLRPDIQDADLGSDDRSVQLRAEWNQGGSARIYTLTLSATDGSGNQSVGRVEVPVTQFRF